MERHQSRAVKRHRAGLKSGNEEQASIHFHSQSQYSQGLYIHEQRLEMMGFLYLLLSAILESLHHLEL